jgi:poly(3-hydroxyalkanoate) synthetase
VSQDDELQQDNSIEQYTARDIIEMVDQVIEEARSIHFNNPTIYEEGFCDGGVFYLELLRQDIMEEYELV